MTEQPHSHKHHHVAPSHHKEGAHSEQYQQPLMSLSESNKIIDGYTGAHDKWVGETYYNKYIRGKTTTAETQKPAHPYIDTAVHYAPEIFAGSGITIAGIAGIIMIRRFIAKVKEVLGRRSRLETRAPEKAKKQSYEFRVRESYPNAVIPVYRIKEKPTRRQLPDTPDGEERYKKMKKVLRVKRQFTCQCCGLVFPHNEFHHLNDNHRDHRPQNLALLCRYCHLNYHVDHAVREGGLSAYLPDFSYAELSHMQQYADRIAWEKKNGVTDFSEHWHYYDKIKGGLDKRCTITMNIIKHKSIKSLIILDNAVGRDEDPDMSDVEKKALFRFHKLRKGLRVVFPVKSAKNNGNYNGGDEHCYCDAAHAFVNADYKSFNGRLDELVERLNKEPEIPEAVRKYVTDNPYR